MAPLLPGLRPLRRGFGAVEGRVRAVEDYLDDVVNQLSKASGGNVTLPIVQGDVTGLVAALAAKRALAFSGASVYNSASQGINNNTATLLVWNTEDYDTGYFNSATSTSKLVVPVTGYYRVGVTIGFPANGSGWREVEIVRNANGVPGAGVTVALDQKAPSSTTAATYMSCTAIARATAGDHFEAFCIQNSGILLTLSGATPALGFQIEYIGS